MYMPKTPDFGGSGSCTSLILRGCNSHVYRELMIMFESTNLSRDNLSREIGRKMGCRAWVAHVF